MVACNNPSAATKTSPSVAVQSPVTAAQPFPNPNPEGLSLPASVAIACTTQIPACHQLALVSLHGINGLVVRDVTDVPHPVTRRSTATMIGGMST
jgi:hypothetical protein